MDLPKQAGNAPIKVNLEKGKRYSWCSCGLSDNQPYCDGKHKGTDYSPVKFVAEESKEAWFCTCKKTSNPVFCDGSHKS